MLEWTCIAGVIWVLTVGWESISEVLVVSIMYGDVVDMAVEAQNKPV